jgi:glycosyltransferase involved in cell wall biosynthesis
MTVIIDQPRVSCIIPAYNEAPRISAVLDVVTAHPLIDEVIVIDDASADGTSAAVGLDRNKVTLIRHQVNAGKTRAVATGIAQARGRFLLLVDSDLLGLQAQALTDLILPVLDDRADLTISLRRNAPRLWHWIGIDYISGERMLRRSLIEADLAELAHLPRFGLEIWMNKILVRSAARLAVVPWNSVDSPLKSRKRGALRGAVADARMMSDLMRTAGPVQVVRQIARMRALRVDHNAQGHAMDEPRQL